MDRINGEWKLISHKGTEKYLKKKEDDDFNDIIFMYSNQLFKCDKKYLTQTQMIGTQKVSEQKTAFNLKSEHKGIVTTTCLNYNKLRTVNTRRIDETEKVDDVEERYMDADGHLVIVNQLYYKFEHRYTVLECARVYEKVKSDSDRKESIKDGVVGMWNLIAGRGIDESRQMDNLGKWATGYLLKFSHAQIFNEIQMQHMDIEGNVLKFNFAVITEEPKYTGTFLFDNSLVTVDGEARIVINVKDDKLFVTCRKNEHFSVAVYQKRSLLL
ncbi:hypothetical protein CAEBREN_09849 [Caenorhabditis brenneri]|uniref:Uncharacterized protein n=1 Tax=Caenorhabditis brenneri TaxID=135651 RepID=G0MC06_CAEBE|nr:hypothetical protein CAEBREN_09849 [Caenorhabditis brenneri]